MKLLFDTHLLLWMASGIEHAPKRLNSAQLSALVENESNELYFSPVAILEVAIKNGLGRAEFRADPHKFRRSLLDNGYFEIPITGEHAAAVGSMPNLHRDPFDRIQIAQATVEGMTLLTNDEVMARYPGPVRKV